MNWLPLNLLKGLLVGFCFFGFTYSYSQGGCGCPLPGTCNPCAGGISEITFKYTGTLSTLITVYDDGDAIFNQMVGAGQFFTVIGQDNGKFDDNEIYVLGTFIWEEIDVSCSMEFDPSRSIDGVLKIVGAKSKNGGNLCCTSNDGSSEPPVISGCPSLIQVNATASCSATVTWTAPQVDQCDAVLTSTHAPGSVFPAGIATLVTYTATNSNNLTSTCTFTVSVIDTSVPVVSVPTPAVTVNADAACKAVATWTPPVFTDNCGIATITTSHNSGSTFSLGTTQVTYTAKDNAGNTTLSKFNVTVKDVTGPTVSGCPGEINVNVTADCKAPATWQPPVFSDPCGSVTVIPSHNPGSQFPVGTTEVTYTGTDPANNKTYCKFNVIVKDEKAPVITACPDNQSASTSTLPGNVKMQWDPPTVIDECSIASLVSTHEPGSFFPYGTTTVTYTATDISGNESTCSFQVNIGWEATKLTIVQLLTPDGNNVNDEWIIDNIEKYENNKVVIIDRWGNVIYSASRYDNERNVWRGENNSGSLVPTGTYFYTIAIHSGPNVIEQKGFIEVVR